jgi:hypothetical protein
MAVGRKVSLYGRKRRAYMKRLNESERVDDDSLRRKIQGDPEGWAEIESWWRSVGLPAGWLYMILRASLIARGHFEESLERSREARSKSGRQRLRQERAIIENVKPFVALLRSARSADGDPIFDDLADEVARAAAALLAPLPGVDAHRPGDPWLADCVVPLASRLKARGLSGKRIYEPIQKALVFAGHESRVTLEKIRLIVQKQVNRPGPTVAPSSSSSESKARRRRTAAS